MTAAALAAVQLRRVLRDRVALFFIVILPVLIILILGVTLQGTSRFRVAVVDQGAGRLGHDLVAALARSDALDLRDDPDLAEARISLRRGELDAVVVLPKGFDTRIRRGGVGDVVVYGDQADTAQQAAQATLRSLVAEHAGRLQAARLAAAHAGGSLEANLARVDRVATVVTPITVATRQVEAASRYLPKGFGYAAPTELVLFVFINGVAGGAAIIETRRLGLYARIGAAPVPARAVVAGETLASLARALLQSVLIVGIGAAVFGVDWGPPGAAVVLVVLWSMVGTGAGVLAGTLFRTPEQAGSLGPILGIAFGMLGGCMWPLEIVGSAMRRVGHLVPHAWAVDAWITLLSKGGGLADIAGDLAVLGGFVAVLFVLAVTRLHRQVVTG